MPTIQASDLKARLPDVTSSLQAAALDGEVTIVRDQYGVPHIKARTSHDAFFAQGFVTAQDRLFHMDYDRMRALGRWSEWVGESALAQDTLMRKLGLGRAAGHVCWRRCTVRRAPARRAVRGSGARTAAQGRGRGPP